MSESFGIDPSNTTIDPSNVAVTIIKETFVELIKKILLSDEEKKKYSITLTSENLDVINKIISLTPNTFNDIEKAIKDIISDGKINSNDVPQLIVLVQRVYHVIYELKNTKFDSKKRAEISANVIKFIIHVLVEERKIKIEKANEEEFYKQTNLLIDSCVSLLSFPKSIKTKGCLKGLFGK